MASQERASIAELILESRIKALGLLAKLGKLVSNQEVDKAWKPLERAQKNYRFIIGITEIEAVGAFLEATDIRVKVLKGKVSRFLLDGTGLFVSKKRKGMFDDKAEMWTEKYPNWFVQFDESRDFDKELDESWLHESRREWIVRFADLKQKDIVKAFEKAIRNPRFMNPDFLTPIT